MDVVGLLRVRSLPQMCSQLAMEHSALESPPPPAATNTEDDDDTDEDDDISVGCPSPSAQQPSSFNHQQLSPASTTSSGASSCFSTRTTLHDASDEEDAAPSAVDDDYFKPLKRLKMMKINKSQPEKNRVRVASPVERHTNRGGSGVKSFFILDILNHRPERAVSEPTAASRIVRPWDLGTGATGAQHRPKSADFCYASETTCSSGRSSTAGSDCCTSPDIGAVAVAVAPRHGARHLQRCAAKAAGPKGANTSPLDALFQMTSKTFEELNGEAVADGQANHLNLFNSRQQAKKKRKSRTAFTNHQIFELEKRFLYQKYLSPADRDEIAGQLGLSNAQVITWFQNRRAKLKRDMEELKKDVESTKLLSAHKSFLENVTDLGILKKKSPTSGGGAVVTDGGGGDK